MIQLKMSKITSLLKKLLNQKQNLLKKGNGQKQNFFFLIFKRKWKDQLKKWIKQIIIKYNKKYKKKKSLKLIL